MLEKIVDSTSSSNNIHKVVNANSNCYESMVIDAMRMNHYYSCKVHNEESNINATKIFKILKDFNKLLWDECTNHNKLLVIGRVFTIKSYYKLSEISYDSIIEWTKNILLDRKILKENFYITRSMINPLT